MSDPIQFLHLNKSIAYASFSFLMTILLGAIGYYGWMRSTILLSLLLWLIAFVMFVIGCMLVMMPFLH